MKKFLLTLLFVPAFAMAQSAAPVTVATAPAEGPSYPAAKLAAGVSAKVEVKVTINDKADVVKAEVTKSSGDEEFDNSAIAFAKASKYKAAKSGETSTVTVDFDFDAKS